MRELSNMKSTFSIKEKTHLPSSDDSRSIQEIIEEGMQEIINLGHYEAVYLFDRQGLPIAQARPDEESQEHRVIEISLMMLELKSAVYNLAGITELKEIMVEGKGGRKIIFRFIPFYGDLGILVAVIPAHKTYRGLTNRLERAIKKLGAVEEE